MSNLSRKTTILAKVESTAGTEDAPSASTDAQLVFGDGAGVYSQDTTVVDDPSLRNSLTQFQALVGRTTGAVTLGTKLMTSQKPGDASPGYNTPWFDALIRGCGWTSATGAGSGSSSTVYTPVSDAFKTLTFYAYADGILHKVIGAQGSWTLDMTAGAAPNMTFSYQGEYVAPATAATPTITYPSDNKTLVENEGFTIGSFSNFKVRSINLSWSNTISEIPDANDTFGHGGYELTARAPTLTCQVSVPDDDLDTFDPFGSSGGIYTATPSDNITFTHSTSATDQVIFQINAPQLVGVSYADTGGVRDYSLSYRLWNSTDDGEASITFKKAAS